MSCQYYSGRRTAWNHGPTFARRVSAPTTVGGTLPGLTGGAPAPKQGLLEQRNGPTIAGHSDTATGIRTRVSAMRGRRPSPLDDSGAKTTAPRLAKQPRSLPAAPPPEHRRSLPQRPSREHRPAIHRPFARVCDIFASPRGCGGIGRRARFRSVSGKPGGGSSPLIRISASRPKRSTLAQIQRSRTASSGRGSRTSSSPRLAAGTLSALELSHDGRRDARDDRCRGDVVRHD
jgi:hypothetical protein